MYKVKTRWMKETKNESVSIANILMSIEEGKREHGLWMSRVNSLVESHTGKKREDDGKIGRTHNVCEFGKWLSLHSPHLKKLKSLNTLVIDIDKTHEDLHAGYGDIYDIFYVATQNRPLSYIVWFKKKKEVHAEEKRRLNEKLSELKEISKKLMGELESLQAEVKLLDFNELKRTFTRTLT